MTLGDSLLMLTVLKNEKNIEVGRKESMLALMQDFRFF